MVIQHLHVEIGNKLSPNIQTTQTLQTEMKTYSGHQERSVIRRRDGIRRGRESQGGEDDVLIWDGKGVRGGR